MRVLAARVTCASDTLSSHSPGLPSLRRFEASDFTKNDLQVLITDPVVAAAKVLSSFATISTAGCVAVHAISGAGSYLELNSAI